MFLNANKHDEIITKTFFNGNKHDEIVQLKFFPTITKKRYSNDHEHALVVKK